MARPIEANESDKNPLDSSGHEHDPTKDLIAIIVENARARGLQKVAMDLETRANPEAPKPEFEHTTILKFGAVTGVNADREFVIAKSLHGFVSAFEQTQSGTLSDATKINMFMGHTEPQLPADTTRLLPETVADIYACLGIEEIAEGAPLTEIGGWNYRNIDTPWGITIHEKLAPTDTAPGHVGIGYLSAGLSHSSPRA